MDTHQNKICKKCGLTKSLEDFPKAKTGKYGRAAQCKDCKRAYKKAWSIINADKIAIRNAAYHHEHLAEHRVRDKAYRESHKPQIQTKQKRLYEKQKAEGRRWQDRFPEQKRASDRASYHKHIDQRQTYREENKEKRNEQWQDWAARNPDHLTDYRQTHREETKRRRQKWAKDFPERNAAREARRRARKRQLPDMWPAEQIAFMLDYWQHACAVCGNPKGLFWTLAHDHWIPVTSPECPGTIATNMIPLCHGDGGCNNSKHAKEPHAWLVRKFGIKKAAQIEKKIAAYFAVVVLTFPEQGDRS